MTEYICKDCAKAVGRDKSFRMTLHKCETCKEEKICNVYAPPKARGKK